MHVLSYEVATDGARFEEYLRKNPIDVLKIMPSHLSALLGRSRMGERMLPERYLILGGEALSYELVERIQERGARVRGDQSLWADGDDDRVADDEGERVRMRSGGDGDGADRAADREYEDLHSGSGIGAGAGGSERRAVHLRRRSGEGLLGKPELTAERFIPNLFDGERMESDYTGREMWAGIYRMGRSSSSDERMIR